MAGLDYGNKYTYTHETRKRKKICEPGVYFNPESNKYIVMLKNETSSQSAKPLNSIAQFNTEKEALKFFKTKSKIK